MVNVDMLKDKITESGFSIEDFAHELGIDRSTLYRKLSKKSRRITIEEAEDMAKILKLSPEEATNIFFAFDVA